MVDCEDGKGRDCLKTADGANPEEAKWYVVHTYAGYENKVASSIEKIIGTGALGGMIKEVKVPTVTVTEIKNDKKREVEQKLFPSYVFVRMEMNNDSWYIIKNTRGVTGFVGIESKPRPLSDEEMNKFDIKDVEPQIKLNFDVGDLVTVIGGALEGCEGLVESINRDKGSAKVLVNMFGRKTSAELEFKDLRACVS
ncbi:transcription termination/antitermination protein NusG [Clostridia bacterium]|nr:transcription termination/antitermination protein NusG [Clostridia bacterium]